MSHCSTATGVTYVPGVEIKEIDIEMTHQYK